MKNRQVMVHNSYNIYKPIITQLFKNLRKKGIVARQNFSCCGSCGSYELFNYIKDTDKIGYVFWHHQENERFKKHGGVFLHFSSKTDDDDVEAIKIGKTIVDEIIKLNLPYEWNESASECIYIGQTK